MIYYIANVFYLFSKSIKIFSIFIKIVPILTILGCKLKNIFTISENN